MRPLHESFDLLNRSLDRVVTCQPRVVDIVLAGGSDEAIQGNRIVVRYAAGVRSLFPGATENTSSRTRSWRDSRTVNVEEFVFFAPVILASAAVAK